MKPQNVFQGILPERYAGGWITTWWYKTELGEFREEQQPAIRVKGGEPFTVAVEHYGLTHKEPSLQVLALVELDESPVILDLGMREMHTLPCALNRIEL